MIIQPNFKYTILCFGESKKEYEKILPYFATQEYEVIFTTDPREYLKIFSTKLPVVCFIDLDVQNSKIPQALIGSLRKIYGKGLLIFGITKLEDSPTIDFALANDITSIVSKFSDSETFFIKVIDVIHREYKPQTTTTNNKLPNIVSWFFDKLSLDLAKLATSLENIDEVETRLQFYLDRLSLLSPQIINMVKALTRTKDELTLTQALRIYGFDNCRNLLVTQTLQDTLESQLFKWDEKTGKLSPEPKSILTYSIKALTNFIEEGRYHQVAFNSGLLFDYFHYLNETSQNKNPALKKFIESRFDIALSKAKSGFKKAKSETDLSLEKHIITFYFLNEASKIMMTFHFKDYPDFLNKLEKKNIKPILIKIAEEAKFGVSSNLLGLLLSQTLPGLSDASLSLLFGPIYFLLGESKIEHDAKRLCEFCLS
jgi:hypothetical protein